MEWKKEAVNGCAYNDEIKVGEYVRTIEGNIFKIVKIRKRVDHILCDTENFGTLSGEILKAYTEKHSHKIKDLIKPGDYVNGKEVYVEENEKLAIEKVECMPPYDYIEDIEIETIATKEQLEQIEYKVKE